MPEPSVVDFVTVAFELHHRRKSLTSAAVRKLFPKSFLEFFTAGHREILRLNDSNGGFHFGFADWDSFPTNIWLFAFAIKLVLKHVKHVSEARIVGLEPP